MNVHIVQKGDTLWKIARQNGVSFDELKRMNAHLANPDYIVPGMKIFLPDKAAGKKEQIVHPFHDGRPPKTVVLPEQEQVVEMPVVKMPKEKVVHKEKVIETPPIPTYIPPVQPAPIPQPIQMPHYHAIQYVPITKNFYSVQQSAQVQAPPPPPPPPPPPQPIPYESPMVEEIVEEHFEQPMEMPIMVQPHFTGPICGCPPMPEFCPPVFPCHPCMHPMHMFPIAPIPTPYFDMQPYGVMPGMGYGQMMPGMGYEQMMPGTMPEQMVQGVMEEEMLPEVMPEQMMGYPSEMPLMESPELAGQMAGHPEHAGWVLESSSNEPSSFLEKFEHHHHHGAPGQVAGAYGHLMPGQVAGAYGYQAPGHVAGAYAQQGAPIYPDYYGFEQGYPMAAAPYNYNPYMMPGQFGYGPGPGTCNCY